MGSSGFGGSHNMVGAGRINGYPRGWMRATRRTLERELELRGLRFPSWWGAMLKAWRLRQGKP